MELADWWVTGVEAIGALKDGVVTCPMEGVKGVEQDDVLADNGTPCPGTDTLEPEEFTTTGLFLSSSLSRVLEISMTSSVFDMCTGVSSTCDESASLVVAAFLGFPLKEISTQDFIFTS